MWIVLVIAILTVFAIAGCAPQPIAAIYVDEPDMKLVICHYEEAPNGEPVLWCFNDQDRGVW